MNRIFQIFRTPNPLLTTAFLLCTALFAHASVSITDKPAASIPLSESYNLSVTLSRTTDVHEVRLWFYAPGSDTTTTNGNSIRLTADSTPGVFSTPFPILPAGSFSWRVIASYNDDSTDESPWQTTTIVPQLTYNRWHDGKRVNGTSATTNFDPTNGWEQVASSIASATLSSNFVANAVNGSTWIAQGVGWAQTASSRRPNYGTGSKQVNSGSNPYPTLFFWNNGEENGPAFTPFIRSAKLDGGVGAITFEAKPTDGSDHHLSLQYATTQSEPSESDWHTFSTTTLPTSGKSYYITNVLNNASATYLRIRRLSRAPGSSRVYGLIGIDGIHITRPAPDVTMHEVLRNPGYPAVNEPVLVRCKVRSKNLQTPAYNRNMTLHYKFHINEAKSITTWNATNMVLERIEGDYEVYCAEIPASAATQTGFMHYFFECNFQGHHLPVDQIIGKEFYYNGETTRVDPRTTSVINHCTYEIRPFKSRFSTIFLRQTIDGGESVNYEMSLSGDNEWQTTAPITQNSRSEAFFLGYDGYLTNATEFLTTTVRYGDNDQPSPYETPTGGHPERTIAGTETLSPIIIDSQNDGYLLYRLCDADESHEIDLNYTIKRGVYQDFNNWEADPDKFNKSNFGANIGVHQESFNDWNDADDWLPIESGFETFQNNEPSSDFLAEGMTARSWAVNNARIVEDRSTNNAAKIEGTNDPFRNRVLHLQAGSGRITSTGYSVTAMPQGAGKFTAQLRSAISDNKPVIFNDHGWTYGADSATALNIETTFKIPLNCRPKSKYYFSIVFNYRDEANYHEARFIHRDSNNASDNCIRFEFCRTINGVSSALYGWDINPILNEWNANSPITIKTRVYRNNTNRRCTMQSCLQVGTHNIWGNYNAGTTDGTDSDLYLGGKVGFIAYDCVPQIQSINIYNAKDATYGTPHEVANNGFDSAELTKWDLGGIDPTWPANNNNPPYRWYAENGSLTRRIPRQTFVLTSAPFLGGAAIDPPVATSAWMNNASFETHSLTYETFEHNLSSWQSRFVRLALSEGDGYGVVDRVEITPWRAPNRGATLRQASYSVNGDSQVCWNWTPLFQNNWLNSPAERDSWHVLEGWVVTNTLQSSHGPSACARLVRSQANPDLAQAVVSPVLENGIGILKFDYRVTRNSTSSTNAIYAIEYSSKGDMNTWEPFGAPFTNKFNEVGFRSHEIRVNHGPDYPARVRIRLLPESDPEAVLFLDNFYVNDYPPETPDMWKVYNGCITTNAFLDASRIFDKKVLYLNNSQTEDIPDRVDPFSEHEPFLQSPRIPEGIGEISFMYRTFSPSKPGKIDIKIAPSEDTPDADWTTLESFVVNNVGYIKFSNPTNYAASAKFLRLYSSTDSDYGRVCIDNVLVTEPSRPGYDITRVWISPEQPLVAPTNNPVFAQIGREMQKPKNIRIFASWKLGEDSWGYTNWWSSTLANTIELYRIGDTDIFGSLPDQGLPSAPANGTIQYVVWGLHDDIPANFSSEDVIFQRNDSFTNPPWYGDINLNEVHIDDGFSPYYFIYSCAPGAVWINEVWAPISSSEKTYPDGSAACEFIELAGKAGTDISGWQIKVFSTSTLRKTIVIPPNTTIPNDQNGWGFYVLGDPLTPNVDLPDAACRPNADNPAFKYDYFWNSYPGAKMALHLLRDSGIVEQRLALASGSTNVQKFNDGFHSFAVPKQSAYKELSLGLLDHYTEETEEFYATPPKELDTNVYVLPYTNNIASKVWFWEYCTPTPGTPNIVNPDYSGGQSFAPGTTLYYLVTSFIDFSKYGEKFGTQNFDGEAPTTDDISTEIEEGAPRSIVYLAGNWYKIESLTINEIEVPEAAGKSSFTLDLSTIRGNSANIITFAPKTAADFADAPDPNTRWSNQILDWFRLNGWTEAQISTDDGDGFSIQEEYLLNTSPLKVTVIENPTSAITCDDGTVSLSLRLLRLDDGIAVTAPINGTVNVYGKPTLSSAEWSLIEPASGSSEVFSNTEFFAPAPFNASSLGLNFFEWKIE